ncbi:hypothetical protein FLAG1_05768 [Fusarium langsethiae]|uniref:Uncharacterized protein n=1 Tax=Fusarium langsethiae TaxID=179993 RepID=A0A0N0V6T8_FUSLA|nr:hypothetical protein FLAG1_05768 [Fusarium langsethiae]GKU07875.1 unnamed protein product [Fusarium langsethiae]GKU19050.1 unnamed protein product [Fusarium langsethiae]
MPPGKKKSERFRLSEGGFFYDEDLTHNPLPLHVELLRQSMLDFAFENLELDMNVDKDDAVKEKAERFARGGYSEEHWKVFFRENFFNPLEQSALITNGSRRVSRCNYYYDTIKADSEAMWVIFNGTGQDGSIPGSVENRTQPKPDYGFYLPMYHLTDGYDIPETTEHKGLKWHKSSTPLLVESFSWSVLKSLHKHGLQPSPVNIFDVSDKKPRETDLKCYPWLVVEHKKCDESEKSKNEVCRQAVNASGCAVRLNQLAAKYAFQLTDEAHVPPIPTVTSIGPKVKVWITYFGKGFMAYHDNKESWRRCNRIHGGYVMQCIWKGDMTQPRDIVRFRLILENTYTWATRVFKPLIATYIDQWRLAHPNVEKDDSTRSTPKRTPRRSPRIRSRGNSRPPPEADFEIGAAAMRLRATVATGAPKKRGSASKCLAPPLEFDFAKLDISDGFTNSDTGDDNEGLYWDYSAANQNRE